MILLLTSILSSKLLEFIFLNLLGETSGTFGSIVGFILPYSIALEFILILKKLRFLEVLWIMHLVWQLF